MKNNATLNNQNKYNYYCLFWRLVAETTSYNNLTVGESKVFFISEH